MKQAYEAIEKATRFEKKVLDNGLTVLVHFMPGFTGVHAIYGTHFGSVDRKFLLDGKPYEMPAGTAHFLEHKMFENEEGDAFTLYAKTGASANAYTGFDRTCYIFTATDRIDENLDILLSFVSRPYFTEETVHKEQGIIGQEIKMYDDAAEWRLMFSLYDCLYHEHPLKDDIAGTVESIAEITPELLYRCTQAFYRPQNMTLAVAGNVTMETVMAAVERAKIAPQPGTAQRVGVSEPSGICCKHREFSMAIAKPMLGLGFKEAPAAKGERLKTELICEVLTELVCGSMTPLYRVLYDEHLAGPDFSGEVLSVPGAFSVLFGGETEDPARVEALLMEEIARLAREGVDEELFRLCKNQMYGELLAGLENVEDAATGLLSAWLRGRTPAEELQALAALTPADVNEALRAALRPENSAVFTIYPREKQEADQ